MQPPEIDLKPLPPGDEQPPQREEPADVLFGGPAPVEPEPREPALPLRRFYVGGVLVVLAAAFCQVAIGQHLSKTGEMVGFGVPVPTVVLVACLALAWLFRRVPWLPRVGWREALYLALLSVGILAMTRADLPQAVKELIQAGEIMVLAAWLVQGMNRRERRALLAGVGVLCPVALALLWTGANGWSWLRLSPVKAGLFAAAALPCVGVWRWRRPAAAGICLTVLGAIAGMSLTSGGVLIAWLVAMAGTGWVLARRSWLWVFAAMAVTVAASVKLPHGGTSPWQSLSPRYDQSHYTRTYLETEAALLAPRRAPLGGGLGRYKATINDLRQYLDDVPHPANNKVPTDSNDQYLLTLVEAGVPAALALALVMLGGALAGLRGTGGETAERALGVALVALLIGGAFGTILSRGIGIWTGTLLGLVACRAGLIDWRKSVRRLFVAGTYLAGALVTTAALSPAPLNGQLAESPLSKTARRLLYGDASRPFGPPREERADALAGSAGHGLRVEAESVACTRPFVLMPDNGASGGEAVSLPQVSVKGQGRLRYTVEIPVAGKYRLTARVRWSDGCANSFGFRAGEHMTVLSSQLYHEWHVLGSKRLWELPAGPLDVDLENLETGVALDWWELTRVQ